MLFNRRLEVSLAKKDNPQEVSANQQLDITKTVTDVSLVLTKSALIIFGAYLAMDTARQILVKLTPSG